MIKTTVEQIDWNITKITNTDTDPSNLENVYSSSSLWFIFILITIITALTTSLILIHYSIEI